MLERSLKGSFGFTSQGALVANSPPAVIGPFGEIGRQTFDGRGNTEGTRRHHAAGEGGHPQAFQDGKPLSINRWPDDMAMADCVKTISERSWTGSTRCSSTSKQ